jgi:uncharacterized protein YlaN (UPF0358 family)
MIHIKRLYSFKIILVVFEILHVNVQLKKCDFLKYNLKIKMIFILEEDNFVTKWNMVENKPGTRWMHQIKRYHTMYHCGK